MNKIIKPASHCPTDRRIGWKIGWKIGQWENLLGGKIIIGGNRRLSAMSAFGPMIGGNFRWPMWDLVRRSASGTETIGGKSSEQMSSDRTTDYGPSDSFIIGQWDAGFKWLVFQTLGLMFCMKKQTNKEVSLVVCLYDVSCIVSVWLH